MTADEQAAEDRELARSAAEAVNQALVALFLRLGPPPQREPFDVEAGLAEIIKPKPPAPVDNDLRERLRKIVNRLAAHAKGFGDVLEEADRGPWGRLVCGDIEELRAALADENQPTEEAERFGPDVVAYRHPVQPRAYLCRQHGDGKPGLIPLTAEDLEYGGLCAECEVDVLIPQTKEGR